MSREDVIDGACRLRELEREEVVNREVHHAVPPQVPSRVDNLRDYRLRAGESDGAIHRRKIRGAKVRGRPAAPA